MTHDNPMLFAMIEAGGGHKSPAVAVAESMAQLFPTLPPPRIVDFCAEVGAAQFDAEHKAQWDALLKRPFLTSFGYEVQDRFGHVSKWYVRRWARDFFAKTEHYLAANTPPVFFATHWLNAAAAIHARQKTGIHFPIVYFLTEAFDASSLHSWEGIDRYLVSSREAADCLARRGVNPKRITVTGYPVRPSFFASPLETAERAALLHELGCDPNVPTLLMSSGAQGVGRIENLAPRLAETRLAMNIIVVCSRNAELLEKLQPLRRNAASGLEGSFIPLGFRSDMGRLLQAADLVAIKAGPASTFEALYSGKPILFMDHVARFERMNAEFVTGHRMGWLGHSEDDTIAKICTVARNPGLIAEAVSRIRELKLKNGADQIARILHDLPGDESPHPHLPSQRRHRSRS